VRFHDQSPWAAAGSHPLGPQKTMPNGASEARGVSRRNPQPFGNLLESA
jgi:hypothetical protein